MANTIYQYINLSNTSQSKVLLNALHSVKIPAIIRTHNFEIETDVVENDIPLLFSKLPMKRANMKLNFQNNTINIFDENIPLITTNSGHYTIPITKVR